MIVDPDFLDHWRTGMVVDALKDAMAPVYILRLWAHCQERKSDTFVMPTRGLKAQCKFPGDAEAFEAALIEAGFVSRDGDTIVVQGWAEKNASLFAAWENGQKGGRPRKEPKQNPRVEEPKPSNNPAVTHGEPMANPNETDKRREEKNSSSLCSEERRRVPRVLPDEVPPDVLVEAGFDAKTASEFIAHKRRLKAPLTPRAWADHQAESSKAGWSPMAAAEKVMAKSWKGFEAKYVERDTPPGRDPPAGNRQTALEQRNADVASEWLAQQGMRQ